MKLTAGYAVATSGARRTNKEKQVTSSTLSSICLRSCLLHPEPLFLVLLSIALPRSKTDQEWQQPPSHLSSPASRPLPQKVLHLLLLPPFPPPPLLLLPLFPPPPCFFLCIDASPSLPSLPLLLLKIVCTTDPGGAHPTSHPHRRY